jgi:hypothetical protein
MTAIQIEVANSLTFAHKHLFNSLEYLRLCQNQSTEEINGVVTQMLEEIEAE